MAWNVVIVGGGFGGLYAARRLERKLPRHSARITVLSDTNFLLYTPLLPGAAAGTLEPRHVVVPLREELDWADVQLGRMLGLDPGLNELHWCTLDKREAHMRYDQLILAIGSVSRTLPIPGLAEHAVGFKSLADAIALRNRALLHLEIAESLEDPEKRREYLTFVFVGAGYAGVEGIAELQDMVADVIDRYPRCRIDGTRWILAERLDRVMPEIGPRLADFATQELRGRGIEVRTGTSLESVEPDAATLSTGERIPTRTVCWTAGVAPPPLVRELGLPLTEGGRIAVEPTLKVAGHENIWAVGDTAAVPDPSAGGERPTPPTAQHALRQGRLAADNVAAALGHGQPRPFRYKTRGVFVDMGRHKAVVSTPVVRFRGFPAWFAARTYHMLMMPGLGRKLRLVVDWTVALFFGRGSAELGQLGHPQALDAEGVRPLRTVQLTFREGTARDLAATFALAERALHEVAKRQGVMPEGVELTEAAIRSHWLAQRNMVEFLAAQRESRYWLAESDGKLVGFARIVRFGAMEELTELMVDPEHQREGVGRALLDRIWPGDPSPDLGRLVVATGASADLTLYPDFGVMPVTGHWHLRVTAERYLERRAQQRDVREPDTHMLAPERASAEWKRLEPLAIAHERPALHEFFARDRTCLATVSPDGQATGLCWVSSHGEIGPAVGATAEDLVPVVLAALDRVAKTQEPEELSLFCTTIAWWLLRRLRGLGFYVYWPSWIMCSVPLPGLDRYVPTRPPHLL